MTLVFDIGKTNKKCFVFDKKYQVVWKEYSRFEEVKDEDGFPCDDVLAIGDWIKKTTKKLLKEKEFDIKAINFSTYGASLVHIDKEGQPLTPLYNYLKPYPKKLLTAFYKKYGSEKKLALETASPPSGMLNSGFQLYWLKHTQPKVYKKIYRSLHFPQYLSYLFTGQAVSDFTSIGCHTSLWNYEKQDYHDWVYSEGVDEKLAPIVGTDTSIKIKIAGKALKVGVGIHDSSAALLPYLRANNQSFLLISTGTWSIALNPFSKATNKKGLKKEVLNYLQIDGTPVKASRLFLGNEYRVQLDKLQKHYKIKKKAIKNMRFNEAIYQQLNKSFQNYFALESLQLKRAQPNETVLKTFPTFEMAYHQLMLELVNVQVVFAGHAIGKTSIKKIFIDGGFANNDLFVKLIALDFKKYKIRTTQSPYGSALGAAMVLSDKKVKGNFLKKHYAMNKIEL